MSKSQTFKVGDEVRYVGPDHSRYGGNLNRYNTDRYTIKIKGYSKDYDGRQYYTVKIIDHKKDKITSSGWMGPPSCFELVSETITAISENYNI